MGIYSAVVKAHKAPSKGLLLQQVCIDKNKVAAKVCAMKVQEL